uniref:Ulp1 protease-like protein n=1 Tax=Oryza sativa subsp. japonica TaxID=39947 RepID=Q69SX8_ORYSJ|nr:Ulp1 protease-like protein [Oryza sativa Japonica Group]BAD35954.1 Ulp1 protease-like protein [Oryza sativa Japonica Group]
MILLARWFSNQYVAISRTATSIGVREMILLTRWFSNQYVAISRTATSTGVREMILLARWFSNQYVAISRTANFHWCSRDDSTRSLVLEPVRSNLSHRNLHWCSRDDSTRLLVLEPVRSNLSHRNLHWCSKDNSTRSLVLEPVRSNLFHRNLRWSRYDYSNNAAVLWLSDNYYLVLDQRCSNSPITSTSTKLISSAQYRQVFYPEIPYHKRHLALKHILMSLYAVLTKPLRNLRELRLGTPRADKALSDPSKTKDHVRSGRVKGPRALSSKNDSPTTRLGARESV